MNGLAHAQLILGSRIMSSLCEYVKPLFHIADLCSRVAGMNELARFEDFDPLKKPVNTLAIVPQNRKITALGRKAYNVMLCIAQGQGVGKESFRAPLTEIVSGLDFGSNDMELIKKHLKAMASTIVEWNSPTTGEGTQWTVCPLISHATIVKEKGQNFLEWGYAQPLRAELLSPAVFSKLSIGMLSQMHTHAGIVLFEICTRYKNIGRTSRQHWRWWLPVLTGSPVSERLEKTEYRFFKRDTLKPAIAEVCAITDLEIELVEYREGKNIVDLQFLVRVKAQASLPLKAPPRPVDLSIVKKATELGINEDKAEELIAKHGEEGVNQGLDDLKARMSNGLLAPVREPFRYLKAALSGAPLTLPEEPVTNPVEIAAEASRKQSELKAAWSDEWLRRQKGRVVAMLKDLSEDRVRELEKDLAAELQANQAHPSLIKRLLSNGWDHSMVRHLMIDSYAKAVIGEDWNSPPIEALLDIASESARVRG